MRRRLVRGKDLIFVQRNLHLDPVDCWHSEHCIAMGQEHVMGMVIAESSGLCACPRAATRVRDAWVG